MMMLHSKQEFSIKLIAAFYTPLFIYYITHICTILYNSIYSISYLLYYTHM